MSLPGALHILFLEYEQDKSECGCSFASQVSRAVPNTA